LCMSDVFAYVTHTQDVVKLLMGSDSENKS